MDSQSCWGRRSSAESKLDIRTSGTIMIGRVSHTFFAGADEGSRLSHFIQKQARTTTELWICSMKIDCSSHQHLPRNYVARFWNYELEAKEGNAVRPITSASDGGHSQWSTAPSIRLHILMRLDRPLSHTVLSLMPLPISVLSASGPTRGTGAHKSRCGTCLSQHKLLR